MSLEYPSSVEAQDSKYVPQPFLAYVDVDVVDSKTGARVPLTYQSKKGNPLTMDDPVSKIRPAYLQSFSYTRRSIFAGNLFEMQLFDHEWDVILTVLLKNFYAECPTQILFRYYVADGLSSPWYAGIIQSVLPHMMVDGVQLDIKGASIATKGKYSTKYWSYLNHPNWQRISDVVHAVANLNGWGTIDPVTGESTIVTTKMVVDCNGLESTNWNNKVFTNNGEDMFAFLQRLADVAVSEEGESGYLFYFDDELYFNKSANEPQPIIHFHPAKIRRPPYKIFHYFRGDKMSEVLDFNPDFTFGGLLAVYGGNEILTPNRDSINRLQKDTKINNDTYKTDTAMGPKRPDAGKSTDNNSAVGRINKTADKHAANASNKAERQFTSSLRGAYKATATILMDPRIQPQQVVGWNVYKPNMEPFLPACGNWLITQVTDRISAGSATSELTMVANANQIGQVTINAENFNTGWDPNADPYTGKRGLTGVPKLV